MQKLAGLFLGLSGICAMTTTSSAQTNVPNAILSADTLTKVSPHVWTISGYPNVAIVVGTAATLVIDTGMGPTNGRVVSQAARSLSHSGQKLFLTTTHFHPEHASGDGGFPAGTVTIRPRVQQAEVDADGARMIDAFRKRSDSYSVLLDGVTTSKADVLFDNNYDLDLGGGVKATLLWYGPAHTEGDELVFVAPDSVLVSGDVVQNKTIPNFTFSECSPAKWLSVLDRIAPLSPRLIVPDHSPTGTTALISAEGEFLQSLQSRVATLKKSGMSLEDCERVVASELTAKYAGWASLERLPAAIERAYNST